MSIQRIARNPTQKKGKGPNGRGFCKWCEKEVPKGRRAWCSEECCDESSVRTDPGFARTRVFRRDKGVCAQCSIDTERVKAEADRLMDRIREVFPDLCKGVAAKNGFLRGLGFTQLHLWEADHIIPVSEGGGECGLDNLRTLCVPCHKTATAQLRGRLAAAARREKEGAVQQSLAMACPSR